MKKIILLLFIISYNNCYAIFGIDGKLELLSKKYTQIQSDLSLIKSIQLDSNVELGTIKSNVGEIYLKVGQINTELSAKITGLDNSVSTKLSAGRDAISNQTTTNDTKLMMYIIKGLCGLCVLLISIISMVVKKLLQEQSNSRFYQTSLAKISDKEIFDQIMREKKELNEQKTIIAKLLKTKNKIFNNKNV